MASAFPKVHVHLYSDDGDAPPLKDAHEFRWAVEYVYVVNMNAVLGIGRQARPLVASRPILAVRNAGASEGRTACVAWTPRERTR